LISKIFIKIVHLNPWLQKTIWKWWYQRLALRAREANWTFMNYGFLHDSEKVKRDLIPEDEDDRVFIQLYDYAVSRIPIEGKNVIEVGSGRGGGASFISRYHKPKHLTGLDYSSKAVKLSNEIHVNISNLSFIQGDAEKIPFENDSFDVVINVESSHCYGNINKFISEVIRVLKPGGYFSWVDLRASSMVIDTENEFRNSDLVSIKDEVITSNVISALDEIHDRKEDMINVHVPSWIQSAFRDFAGVKDSKIYNAFKNGNSVYLSKVFQKKKS